LNERFGRNRSQNNQTFEVHHLGEDGYGATTSISSANGHETIDASGDANNQDINLNPGKFSSVKGYKNNLSITSDTFVEDVKTGSGTNRIVANVAANNITLGAGNNTVVYEHELDGDQDKIIGFKTGKDKVDVSALFTRDAQESASPIRRVMLVTESDGRTFLQGYRQPFVYDGDAPSFSIAVDGAKPGDILTGRAGEMFKNPIGRNEGYRDLTSWKLPDPA
jgi:hypothetical protein